MEIVIEAPRGQHAVFTHDVVLPQCSHVTLQPILSHRRAQLSLQQESHHIAQRIKPGDDPGEDQHGCEDPPPTAKGCTSENPTVMTVVTVMYSPSKYDHPSITR